MYSRNPSILSRISDLRGLICMFKKCRKLMAQFRTELQANLLFSNTLFSLTGVQVLYFFFPWMFTYFSWIWAWKRFDNPIQIINLVSVHQKNSFICFNKWSVETVLTRAIVGICMQFTDLKRVWGKKRSWLYYLDFLKKMLLMGN